MQVQVQVQYLRLLPVSLSPLCQVAAAELVQVQVQVQMQVQMLRTVESLPWAPQWTVAEQVVAVAAALFWAQVAVVAAAPSPGVDPGVVVTLVLWLVVRD